MARKQPAPETEKPVKRVRKAPVSHAVPVAEPLFLTVGFGASAGGLETFSEVLRHLPPDTGMAFILVQHLDPRHASMLSPLLAKATTMPVQEVRDGTRIAPNCVYVIPPNANMGVLHGALNLLPRGEGRAAHMPVDFFLESLAKDQGNKAIGVILSGTGSDGTQGLRAIKEQGGITFAQDWETAKYDGMPKSAIAAGVVDFVLPPARIGEELARIGRHPYLAQPHVAEAELLFPQNEDALQKIFLLIRDKCTIDFTHYKHTTIKRRILRRMLLHKIDTLENYVRYLHDHRPEVTHLCDDILIGVTSFFRDPEVFDPLKGDVITRILANRAADTPVRVWVAGCASGEEAYSIAICFLEALGASSSNVPLQIFASDVSEGMLDKARAGVYPDNIADEVSAERLHRFFVKAEGGGYRIARSLRDICLFARHDLTRDTPFSRLDLVCCRNLLIYLGAPLQKRVLASLHYALKPQGFLMLGTSESIGSHAHLFSLIDKKTKLYVKKESRAHPEFGPIGQRAPPRPAPARQGATPGPALQNEVDRIILAHYAPAAMLVDDGLEVLQFRGRVAPYLEPATGPASLKLMKIIKQSLALDLRALIQKVAKNGTPLRQQTAVMDHAGKVNQLDIEVVPINPTHTLPERSFLVLFNEGAAQPEKARRGRKTEEAETRQLRQELDATREFLQSTIEEHEATNEELRSVNEEAQSSNEELQSINEELETAKEELQSSNEELTTVNDELQNRNQDLLQANDDLANLLASVNMPIVMLGGDLRVRRFTPATERVLNLIHGDVGRHISDLKPRLGVTDLEQLAHEVTQTLAVKERQITRADGRRYVLRMRPYRTADNRIDGVVMVLVETSMAGKENGGDPAEANGQGIVSDAPPAGG